MARLIGPDESVRTVFLTTGAKAGKAAAQGMSVPLYADAGLTVAADVVTTIDGPIPGSPPTLIIDAFSQIPLFKYPNGVDTVYTSINGGPAVALYARTDARLDALEQTTGTGTTNLAAETAARIAGDTAGVQRANHTGTQSADTLTDGTTNKAFLGTERTKLSGVATGATVNAADAALRDRTTHTGAQATSTVTGLDAALTAKADSAVIRGMYALRSVGRRKVGFIGDSITAGDNNTYSPTGVGLAENGDSPATHALFASRGQWQLMQNAAVGGQTSTQILARLQTDIIDLGCDVCVIYSCTWNDIGASFTVAQSVANVTAMLELCLSNNVLAVLCTPTPDGVTGGSAIRKNGISQRRRLYVDLGRSYGVPVVDLFPLLVDATTGAMAAAYSVGDVHPNSAGRQVGGAAVAAVLDRVLAGSAASDVAYAGDTDDMLGGFGFFVVDTNADGVADGWVGSTVTGAVPSIYTDPVLGKVQRLTATATASNYNFTRSATVIPGHVYEISGFLSKTGTAMGQFSFNTATGNRRLTIIGTAVDVTRGKFSFRFIPAAGASAATMYLVAGAGTGTVDFARITIRDLTLLGLT